MLLLNGVFVHFAQFDVVNLMREELCVPADFRHVVFGRHGGGRLRVELPA